jgi:predicted O-linked N-acetylglucosamine transferase (SPINDLY family)
MKIIGRGQGGGRGRQPRLDPDTLALTRLIEARRYEDVERLARSMLQQRPTHSFALKALTFALLFLGRHEEVLPICEFALTMVKDDPELYNNRGIALSLAMRWDEAITSLEAAIRLNPKDPELYKNCGVAYFREHRWNDAVPYLLKAIELHEDDYIDAINFLAHCLANANRHGEAAAVLEQLWAASQEKDNPILLNLVVTVGLRCCDWTDLGARIERMRSLSDNFARYAGAPFAALSWPGLSDADHMGISRCYAAEEIPSHYLSGEARTHWTHVRRDPARLRIGYLSPDMNNHAVGLIVADVLERHDRSRVEIWGFSTGADDGSEIRQRLVRAFDHFVDLEKTPIHACAERIRAEGIDILVDLAGWTTNGKAEVLALRCAPVQTTWLGFAGTLGHSALADYIIGDSTVTPLTAQPHFSETIAQMPNCYLPADTTRIVGNAPTRESQGLPADAFVLCSMNIAYKYNPQAMDLWCGLLQQMPDSVLWLARPHDVATANLKKEVETRGIDSSRLIFAPRTESNAEHLARIQLADLALDTFPYNSHSTGIDALWAGVPLVALHGNTFAGRVGASLLKAVGLDELVAATPEAYGDIVLELYRDRNYLASLRKRLADSKRSAPLFDMKMFARDLEDIYYRMWQNHQAGIKVPLTASVSARSAS